MVSTECHKGSFCVFTPNFCQEGYCSGCEIYLKKSSPIRKEDRRLGETLQHHESITTHKYLWDKQTQTLNMSI